MDVIRMTSLHLVLDHEICKRATVLRDLVMHLRKAIMELPASLNRRPAKQERSQSQSQEGRVVGFKKQLHKWTIYP